MLKITKLSIHALAWRSIFFKPSITIELAVITLLHRFLNILENAEGRRQKEDLLILDWFPLTAFILSLLYKKYTIILFTCIFYINIWNKRVLEFILYASSFKDLHLFWWTMKLRNISRIWFPFFVRILM